MMSLRTTLFVLLFCVAMTGITGTTAFQVPRSTRHTGIAKNSALFVSAASPIESRSSSSSNADSTAAASAASTPPPSPDKNKDKDGSSSSSSYFFASAETPSSPQEYFRTRIAEARQRALMTSLAKNRDDRSTSTLHVIKKKQSTPTPTPTPTKPLAIDKESIAARQSYFAQRIQLSRQRALMANIATAKQAQTRTTDTLNKSSGKTATATTTTTTTTITPRLREARQRALLAAQLSYHAPVLQAARQRAAYFRERIQASRQRALLANIATAKANQKSLTTDTLRARTTAERAKHVEATQRALLTAQLQQQRASTSQGRAAVSKPVHITPTVQAKRQAALLQDLQTQAAQTTTQRFKRRGLLTKEEDEALQTKYAAIPDMQERAYSILQDLGMV